MSLTDKEKQLLEELEKSLAGSKPESSARKLNAGPTARLIVAGLLVAAAGFSILISAVVTRLVFLGAIGFAVMVGGIYLATSTNPKK